MNFWMAPLKTGDEGVFSPTYFMGGTTTCGKWGTRNGTVFTYTKGLMWNCGDDATGGNWALRTTDIEMAAAPQFWRNFSWTRTARIPPKNPSEFWTEKTTDFINFNKPYLGDVLGLRGFHILPGAAVLGDMSEKLRWNIKVLLPSTPWKAEQFSCSSILRSFFGNFRCQAWHYTELALMKRGLQSNSVVLPLI